MNSGPVPLKGKPRGRSVTNDNEEALVSATALILVLISTATTLVTLLVYERVVRDLRYRVQLAEDHADQCQHLVAAMTRHPAKGTYPNLTVVRAGDAS